MSDKLIYILGTSLVLGCLGLLFLALIFIGAAYNRSSFKIAGLSGLVLSNLCLFLMPSMFGFAYFGDSTRHIPWIMSILNGESFFDYSQYTSFYLISITLIKLGMNPLGLLWLCPIVMYLAFISGFCLLTHALKEDGQDNNLLIMVPATIFIFGLYQAAIMPWHMGVCFIPLLLALQIMLSKGFRWYIALISLVLFAGIIFSHPHNLLYCAVLLFVYWWQQKAGPKGYIVLLWPLSFSAGLYYFLTRATSGFVVWMGKTLWGIFPLFPLDILQPQYIIFSVILLAGVSITAYFIKQKAHLPLVASFIAVLGVGLFGLAGLLLWREVIRVFAYALVITLIMVGLFLKKFWNDNKQNTSAMAWKMFLATGSFYIALFSRLAFRYPGIYLETIKWSLY